MPPVENSLEFPQKVKHQVTIQEILLLSTEPIELKTSFEQKHVCKLFTAIIHSCQKVKTTQLLIS